MEVWMDNEWVGCQWSGWMMDEWVVDEWGSGLNLVIYKGITGTLKVSFILFLNLKHVLLVHYNTMSLLASSFHIVLGSASPCSSGKVGEKTRLG